EPEITPAVDRPGVRRFDLDPSDAARNVRAVVEGQMMAMVRHSRWMGVTVDAIRATGGAARNEAILQGMADVFGAPRDRPEIANSAALGAALRAYHADQVADGRALDWDEVVAALTEPVRASRIEPVREHVALYRDLIPIHAAREAQAKERP